MLIILLPHLFPLCTPLPFHAIANRVHLYMGVYDGSTRIVDREAKGVLFYTLPELAKEMEQFPKAFSHDMQVFFNEMRPEMEKFLASDSKLPNDK